MGTPSLLDAALVAPAAALGLLGMWLGFGRSLVAWPMRWLLPLLGACLAAMPAMLAILAKGETSAWLDLSGTAIAGAISFVMTIVLLVMFMRNLRARMADWTRGRRTGLIGRILGALVGTACGLLLVAVPYGLYESLGPSRDETPAWVRESAALAYFRAASEAASSALSAYFSPASGRPRR